MATSLLVAVKIKQERRVRHFWTTVSKMQTPVPGNKAISLPEFHEYLLSPTSTHDTAARNRGFVYGKPAEDHGFSLRV